MKDLLYREHFSLKRFLKYNIVCMAWLLDGGGWSASYADGKILVVFHYRNYILWEEYGDANSH